MKNYESFYQGGYSSLNSDYGNFIGYRLSAGQIGSPTGIQTANQIGEVVSRIKEGVKNVELQPLQEGVMDQIPKQHFKEMRALMKLTGVKPSFHAPIIDPSGFGQKGYEGDIERERNEDKMFAVLEKAQELDTGKNIPVVFHSTGGVPGNDYRPGVGDEKERFTKRQIVGIDQESGQLTGIKEDDKFYPHGMKKEDWEQGKKISAEHYLDITNESQWEQKLTNLAFYQKEFDEINQNMTQKILRGGPEILDIGAKDALTNVEYQKLGIIGNDIERAKLFLSNNQLTFQGLFHNAYKYGSDDQKKVLRTLSEEWDEEGKEIEKRQKQAINQGKIPNPLKSFEEQADLFQNYATKFQQITQEQMDPFKNVRNKNLGAPTVIVAAEEFAKGKASETFGNLAFRSYNEWGDKAPVIAVENMYQGMAFSKAEDLKELVEKARDKFAERLQKEKHMSQGQANKTAEKLIGVTWDVGHLNMIKKAGFTDKDVAQQTEVISKLVKHVHITDNFGFSDSHLPPGMGNVPIKVIMEKLEKAGAFSGKNGQQKARAIMEAAALPIHFKKSPHPYVLEAFGSPLYASNMAPFWNQAQGVQGSYFGFPMAYLPEKHFSMYGSGFSLLPEELGGQMPGTQSRFSGTPNA